LSPYPALAAAWRTSRETFTGLRKALHDADLASEVRCLAVSGSLGRMEQMPHSDVDLIVVLHNNCDDQRATEVYDAVWSNLSAVGLPRPKPTGIFATPTSQAQLCRASDIGKVDEDMAVFGKRIQLLLDAQPLVNGAAFHSLQDAILTRYGQDDALRHGDGCWTYLQRDLIRYFQSMAIHCQWRDRNQAGAWRLRNLKLQHSRRLMTAGLLLTLGECTTRGSESLDWLLSQLRLTPLERIASVFSTRNDEDFATIAACYDQFLAALQDDGFRRRLASPPNDPAAPLDECEDYRRLRRNGRQLAAELQRFLLARRGPWSDRFFESLLI